MLFLKAQSAIEYLMTYGWMLLVVALTGSAVFAVAQNSGSESVSGFTGSDIRIQEFGVTEDGDLQLDLRDGSGEGSTVKAINVTDESTGEYVYKEFSSNNKINVGESMILSLPNVSQTEGSNSLGVEISYDSGGLENMSVEGSISSGLTVDETTEIIDKSRLDGPDASASKNTTNIETNDLIQFNASESTPGDSSITTYSWDIDDDEDYEKTGEIITHSYSTPGEYTVELNVSDGNGLYDADTLNVTVEEAQTQFFTNFSEYSVGDTPSSGMNDWEIGRSSGLSFEIVGDSEFDGDKAFSLQDISGYGNYGTALWDQSGEDLEGVMKFRFYNDDYQHGIRLRYEENSYYMAETYLDTPTIHRVDSEGSSTELGSGSQSESRDTWYNLRFRVNGNELKTRFWEDGNTEPSTWDVEITDSTYSSGKVGLGTWSYSGREMQVDWFGVATQGDEAPKMPVN